MLLRRDAIKTHSLVHPPKQTMLYPQSYNIKIIDKMAIHCVQKISVQNISVEKYSVEKISVRF